MVGSDVQINQVLTGQSRFGVPRGGSAPSWGRKMGRGKIWRGAYGITAAAVGGGWGGGRCVEEEI